MMSLKKQLIKNYLKLQVITNNPGKLHIRIGNLSKVDEQYKAFQDKVIELIKLLDGIQAIIPVYQTGDITILYDATKLTGKQVLKWSDVIVDTAIEKMNFISTYWEKDLDYVMQEMTKLLEEKAKRI